MEDPEHVVERVAVDRVAGIRRVDHRRERLLRREVDRERPRPAAAGPSPRAPPCRRSRRPCRPSPPRPSRWRRCPRPRRRCGGCPPRCAATTARGRRVDAEQARDAVRRRVEHPDERVGEDRSKPRPGARPRARSTRSSAARAPSARARRASRQVREDQERDQERDASRERTGRGSSSRSSGSPRAPSRIENSVIPSWTVPMKRTGLSMIRSAMRAPRLPRRPARAGGSGAPVTSAYSAATKKAFPATSRRTRRCGGGRHAPISGARVLGGSSSKPSSEDTEGASRCLRRVLGDRGVLKFLGESSRLSSLTWGV